MLARFEVRIREADEDLGELVFGEEVGEEFHCVAAKRGDVLVSSRNGRFAVLSGGGIRGLVIWC